MRVFKVAVAAASMSLRNQYVKRGPTRCGAGMTPRFDHAQTVETEQPSRAATSFTRIRGDSYIADPLTICCRPHDRAYQRTFMLLAQSIFTLLFEHLRFPGLARNETNIPSFRRVSRVAKLNASYSMTSQAKFANRKALVAPIWCNAYCRVLSPSV